MNISFYGVFVSCIFYGFCVFSFPLYNLLSHLLHISSSSISRPSLLVSHDLEGRGGLLKATVLGHQPVSRRLLAGVVVDPQDLPVGESLLNLLSSLVGLLLLALVAGVDPHRLEILSLLGGAITSFLDRELDSRNEAGERLGDQRVVSPCEDVVDVEIRKLALGLLVLHLDATILTLVINRHQLVGWLGDDRLTVLDQDPIFRGLLTSVVVDLDLLAIFQCLLDLDDVVVTLLALAPVNRDPCRLVIVASGRVLPSHHDDIGNGGSLQERSNLLSDKCLRHSGEDVVDVDLRSRRLSRSGRRGRRSLSSRRIRRDRRSGIRSVRHVL